MNDTDMGILSLKGLSGGHDWQLSMAHDRPQHVLFWITRGQGTVLLDGRLRGVGPHNAIFLPARSLFALDLGRQGFGQAVVIPAHSAMPLPDLPWQLRVRAGDAQTELTGLVEAAQREQSAQRPLCEAAMAAHVALMSVWLRRQIARDDQRPEDRSGAERLSRRFCRLLSEGYASGASVPDYAEALEVPPTDLSRAVKSATGRSAAELLTDRIIYAARLQMDTTTLPAATIGARLGFASLPAFTRFLEQHSGPALRQLQANAQRDVPEEQAKSA